MAHSALLSSLRGFVKRQPSPITDNDNDNHNNIDNKLAVNVSNLFSWQEYSFSSDSTSSVTSNDTTPVPLPEQGLASAIINQPVYISLTSTSFRIASVHRVIENLFAGFMWPDRLFLFLSSSPYLLDAGVHPAHLPEQLRNLVRRFPVSVVFTGQTFDYSRT